MADPQVAKVLAAIDFSEWTGPVLHTAAELAGLYGAELTALYAETFMPPPYFTERDIPHMAAMLEAQRQAARQALEETARDALGPTRQIRVQLAESAPALGVLQGADDLPADLIVLGTHGRSGLDRLLLGSVAEKVLRQAAVPVLTVRTAGTARLPLRRILCPVNFTEVAGEALKWAADLARRSRAELVALASLEEGTPADLRARQEELCRLLPGQLPSGCTVTHLVRQGEAAEQILQTAAQEECDLLVIGAQHRRLLDATIFGTTSVRVMRHAPCSVLTVLRRAEAVPA